MRSIVYIYSLFAVSCITLFSLSGCGDPSPIGAGVLSGERLDILYTDTIQLNSKTVLSEPLATFRNRTSSSGALDIRNRILGRLDDPITGISETEVYMRLELPTSDPTFTDAVIDSFVLTILYDSVGFYGDDLASHTIEVFQLNEDFPDLDTIFSDQQVMSGNLLGTKSFIPSFRDSVRIIQHGLGTAVKLAPQIRVRLDDALGQQILDNESIIDNDTTFSTFLPGIVLKSTPSTSSLIGLNLSGSTNAGVSNGLTLFYTIQDTIKNSYRFEVSSDIASYISHDISGSTVETFIDNPNLGDSLIVIQGLAGVNAEVKLGGFDDIKDDVINHAEIISFIHRESIIDPSLFPAQPLLLAEYNDEGNLAAIADFNIAFSSGRIEDLFGGTPMDTVVNGVALQYIKTNITSHLKDLIEDSDNPDLDKTLIFNVTSKVQRPGRTILYGPDHSLYPMKLNVTFTDIN